MLQTLGPNSPVEMTNLLLAEIAKLRKMPALAKRIEEFKPTPDPLAQKEAELRIALLEAQVFNEQAKGEENKVDVQLKSAKTATEEAKARNMNSDSDGKDLAFVENEAGVSHAREQDATERKHEQAMEGKEADRLGALDKAAADALFKK
jgi:hypothetical protein